jgi:hypothetical protein
MVAVSQMLSRTEAIILSQQTIATSTSSAILDGRRCSRTEDSLPYNLEEDTEISRDKETILKSKVERTILDLLSFPTMSDRFEEISEAHRRTFEWIFRNTGEKKSWSCYTTWLSSGSGIYWMNGKAGSGKSTLMRHIYNHKTTRQQLSVWAKRTPLSMAHFFFWNSGTSEQKSQIGLLRAILHRVLEEHRALVPIVLPGLWAREYSHQLDGSILIRADFLLVQLMQAFTNLIQQTAYPLKVCFFIDGLDEFEGDHREIASLFTKLAESSNVKVCVSSRPELPFQDAFGSFPNLRLQDLTYNDIRHYVSETLNTNSRYQQLTVEEPLEAPRLEQEIISRADGVFLWVRLVVKSLMDGLGNRDDIDDLQRRLEILPHDLEGLYNHMLSRIDPFYMEKAARMFQVVERALQPLHIFAFALTDDTYAEKSIALPICPWTEGEQFKICQTMEDRIKVRCAGLLEVSDYNIRSSRNSAPYSWGRVQYLHRTVKDFLEKRDVREMILSHTRQTDFDPYISLVRSQLLQLKSAPGLPMTPEKLSTHDKIMVGLSETAMKYAGSIKAIANHITLLDELNKTITFHKETRKMRSAKEWSWPFMCLAVQYNLIDYVDIKLSSNDTPIKDTIITTLLECCTDKKFQGNNRNMAEMLLRHGKSSTRGLDIDKSWHNVLVTTWKNRDLQISVRNSLEVVKLFLEYGADPKASYAFKPGKKYSASLIVEGALRTYHPPDEDEIRALLMRHLSSPTDSSVTKPLGETSPPRANLEQEITQQQLKQSRVPIRK